MKIKELFVDYQYEPLGLDERTPSFSWCFEESLERALFQSAYRIIVTEDKPDQDDRMVWDTGKVISRKNSCLIYDGAPLKSRKRYYWKVYVWDQSDQLQESAWSWWEMGLLNSEDWVSKWIGYNDENSSCSEAIIPLFRTEFNLVKPIKKARAYLSGLGHYELRLNGEKVGDRVLEPGWTNYDKTCLYSTYDITTDLQLGPNAIGIMLGNGFFNVSGGRYTKFKDSYGLPKCLIQVEIDYTDGTRELVCSNDQWKTSRGPITFSCIYGGEDYDARLEQKGWDLPEFKMNEQWKAAVEVTPAKGCLKSQAFPPLRAMETLHPTRITEPKPGIFVVDFGRNFSGWISIKVNGNGGDPIKISPGELLEEDGTINQKPSGSPYEYNYILKGDMIEEWEPRFSYYGFRYVQIEGASFSKKRGDATIIPQILDIKGKFIYPELNQIGTFNTSDEMINQIHSMILQAVLSNTKSVFTDCPHREKLGWLEQVHLVGPAIMYNYQIAPLLTKVINDIRDAQLPNGMIPTTAPEYVAFTEPWDIFRHSVSWAATYILIPWELYRKFGDIRLLIDHYENMKKYIDYVSAKADHDIVKDGLGDWYDIGEKPPGFSQVTPVALPETAMYYHIVDVFTKICDLIDRPNDQMRYTRLKQNIKAAYNEAFFNNQTKQYGSESQASTAMSLVFGLVNKEDEDHVFQHLVDDIEKHQYHTTAGDIAHRYVLAVLDRFDRSDLIYKMSQNTDHPSYGFQIINGATTLTEAWDGPISKTSQNHFMLGHIEEWFFKNLAGLDYSYNPEAELFQITIKPYPERNIEAVNAASLLPNGKVEVQWKWLNASTFSLNVHIPVNSTAIIYLPAHSLDTVKESNQLLTTLSSIEILDTKNHVMVLKVTSGNYQFISMYNDEPIGIRHLNR
ncbi:family 78 glycoside hydrolase catalytic domain [Pullulanibacillus sp. KACC 23026]|uniref:family 78 glycoside hydrolase catalytic domain n=1 Tax=Pullulanibacillus sp. KACC 23026 TaxID=3028315 RepID=UPI0023AF9D9C|nr:family 78 glycoside hydrolase catalytic domain [Pullulanibacillus sp. KACC 23026]WEG11747.1 family 78 glycoside hydrolase catalytic domain [Pullulanibacillus sp. KACC 23026]